MVPSQCGHVSSIDRAVVTAKLLTMRSGKVPAGRFNFTAGTWH
jgi:hypothetical protein